MYQTLGRIQALRELKAYPAQSRDLTFLAGALCGLMANACLDLGREDSADDLARAGWTYGQIIDHGPLMGWARGTQALAAIWDQRYHDAIHHTTDGLNHVAGGSGRIRLYAIQARTLAAAGDPRQAAVVISVAKQACPPAEDDLHDGLGGEFAFTEAKLRYYQALTLNDADDPAAARHAATAAIRLYQARPTRTRSYGCDALAHIQLARAQLATGNIDDAAQTLGAVLAMDPQLRIGSVSQTFEPCTAMLRAPSLRSSPTARRLAERITGFSERGSRAILRR